MVSLVFNVFTNWDHCFFWNLQEPIKRHRSIIILQRKVTIAGQNASEMFIKPLLNSKCSESENNTISVEEKRDVRKYIHDTFLYIVIVLFGIAEMIFFLFNINIIPVVSAFVVIEFIAITWVLKKNLHFEVGFIEISKQFRVWILSLSLGVILVFAALDIYLDYKNNDSQAVDDNDITGFIEAILYCNTILLAIVRDGMIYPLWFHYLLPFCILIPTCYTIYETLFVWTHTKPYWYLYILRTALIQVALLMGLILFAVWRDPKHEFFTLIFHKKKREEEFSSVVQVIDVMELRNGTMEMNGMRINTPSTPYDDMEYQNPKLNLNNDINISGYDMKDIIYSDREQSPLYTESDGSDNSNASSHD